MSNYSFTVHEGWHIYPDVLGGDNHSWKFGEPYWDDHDHNVVIEDLEDIYGTVAIQLSTNTAVVFVDVEFDGTPRRGTFQVTGIIDNGDHLVLSTDFGPIDIRIEYADR